MSQSREFVCANEPVWAPERGRYEVSSQHTLGRTTVAYADLDLMMSNELAHEPAAYVARLRGVARHLGPDEKPSRLHRAEAAWLVRQVDRTIGHRAVDFAGLLVAEYDIVGKQDSVVRSVTREERTRNAARNGLWRAGQKLRLSTAEAEVFTTLRDSFAEHVVTFGAYSKHPAIGRQSSGAKVPSMAVGRFKQPDRTDPILDIIFTEWSNYVAAGQRHDLDFLAASPSIVHFVDAQDVVGALDRGPAALSSEVPAAFAATFPRSREEMIDDMFVHPFRYTTMPPVKVKW